MVPLIAPSPIEIPSNVSDPSPLNGGMPAIEGMIAPNYELILIVLLLLFVLHELIPHLMD